MRDVYRTYLSCTPERLTRITERPEGPLATSHVVRGQARRFDFIYATTDFNPELVTYDTSVLKPPG
jgi:hypothetical protein